MEKKQNEKNVKKAITFRVFDMPVELFQDYVAYAKLYFDNSMWKVLKKGMELIKSDEARTKSQYEERLIRLEDRVASLEKEMYQDPRERGVKTFGK